MGAGRRIWWWSGFFFVLIVAIAVVVWIPEPFPNGVLVSGRVVTPGRVKWVEGRELSGYIDDAGGYQGYPESNFVEVFRRDESFGARFKGGMGEKWEVVKGWWAAKVAPVAKGRVRVLRRGYRARPKRVRVFDWLDDDDDVEFRVLRGDEIRVTPRPILIL